jgi:hypothetical protein
VNVWFNYPIHTVDEIGVLNTADAEGETPPWKKAMGARKPKEKKEKDRKVSLENAIDSCNFGEAPTIQTLSESMGIAERTVRARIKEHGGFEVTQNIVTKKV